MLPKFVKDNLLDAHFYLDLIIIFLTVFLIRTFVVSPFWVSGPSMCNTLNYFNNEYCEWGKGDIMLIDSLSYLNFGFNETSPVNNDVVVFKLRDNSGRYLVKRIIASSGETIRIENGYVYKLIDNQFTRLDEPYLNDTNKHQTFLSFSNAETFVVPDGYYFVMGDNRLNSSDSRNCFYKDSQTPCSSSNLDAFVSRDQIRGKAWLVVYPFSHFGFIN